VSRLAQRDSGTAALARALRRQGLWPPVVPTVVLTECLTGSSDKDSNANWLLKSCTIQTAVSERVARRAAYLRTRARRGSAVDALVVAAAEPGSTILTGDRADLEALAAHAVDVTIEVI